MKYLPERLNPRLSPLRSFKGRLYLVGGPVRDMMLHRPTKDLDFLIEGNERQYVSARKRLLTVFPAKPGTFRNSPFFTAFWISYGGYRVDCARPRKETYSQPGVLPKVFLIGSALDDMKRRDFSANAMALGISKPVFGEWVDPLGGRADVERRLLRILHPASFEDDPTRILRALRLSERLGFEIEAATLQRMHAALRADAFSTLSWERLRDEWLRAFKEENWQEVLGRFLRNGILIQITPDPAGLGLENKRIGSEGEIRLLTLYALSLFKNGWKHPSLSKRAWPDKRLSRALAEIEMLAEDRWRISSKPDAWTLKVLKTARPEWAEIFSRKQPCFADGRDLRALGIPPEKRSALQKRLFQAVLDGEVRSRKEALVYLKKDL